MPGHTRNPLCGLPSLVKAHYFLNCIFGRIIQGSDGLPKASLILPLRRHFERKNIEIAFPQRDIHIRSVVPFPIHGLPDQAEQQGNQEKMYHKGL